MNEMLFRQLERMLKESRYESSCHSYKDIELRVLSLSDDQLAEATQMMYVKGPNGYKPSFNFPNIAYTILEKGDPKSPIFKSIVNRIIFWENFVNEKPNIDADRTYLETFIARDLDLEETEVEKIAMIAMVSKGTQKYEKMMDKVISQYGTPSDNSVIVESSFGTIYSHELFKECEKETKKLFKAMEGYFLDKKESGDINDLKFLVLKHHSFERIIYRLVYQFYATDCIYQAFLDNVTISIENRLEKVGLEYDFLDDIIADRFEIYGMLDMDDEFEKELARDIITIEKMLNIRPYPYNSLMA